MLWLLFSSLLLADSKVSLRKADTTIPIEKEEDCFVDADLAKKLSRVQQNLHLQSLKLGIKNCAQLKIDLFDGQGTPLTQEKKLDPFVLKQRKASWRQLKTALKKEGLRLSAEHTLSANP